MIRVNRQVHINPREGAKVKWMPLREFYRKLQRLAKKIKVFHGDWTSSIYEETYEIDLDGNRVRGLRHLCASPPVSKFTSIPSNEWYVEDFKNENTDNGLQPMRGWMGVLRSLIDKKVVTGWQVKREFPEMRLS